MVSNQSGSGVAMKQLVAMQLWKRKASVALKDYEDAMIFDDDAVDYNDGDDESEYKFSNNGWLYENEDWLLDENEDDIDADDQDDEEEEEMDHDLEHVQIGKFTLFLCCSAWLLLLLT
jgi:hypothetical protein